MSRRVVKIFLVFLSLSTVCLFVCLSILYFFIKYEYTTNEIGDEVEYKEFQTLHFDPLNDEFSFGTATIQNQLGEGEYLFSSSVHENHEIYELISPFGEDEYMCTGMCYCDENERRSSRISRGIPYLLVAISNLVAFELAKKYFDEACVKEHSMTCSDPLFVRSEVEDCQKVVNILDSVPEKGSEAGTQEPKEPEYWTYRCKGNCVLTDHNHFYVFYDMENMVVSEEEGIFYKGKKSLSSLLPNTFNPKPTDKDLEIDAAHHRLLDYCMDLELSRVMVTVGRRTGKAGKTESAAREIFSRNYLDSFCMSNSKIKNEEFVKDLSIAHQDWLDNKALEKGELDTISDPIRNWCEMDDTSVICNRMSKVKRTETVDE